jgi:hypothetical protein
VGKVTTFQVQGVACDAHLQIDFVRAPHGITEAMKHLSFYPSDFIGALYIDTPDCVRPKPKPTPEPTCEETRTCQPVDVCPNLEGPQSEVPEGYTLVEGECVQLPPPPVDVCPNIEGAQSTVPEGYKLAEGQCVPLTCDELHDASPYSGSATKQVDEHPQHHNQKQIRRRSVFSGWGDWQNASDFEYATCGGFFCERRIIEVADPSTFSVTVTGSYFIGVGDGGTYLIEIVYDPINFTKKSIQVTVPCGQAAEGGLTWGQGDQYNSSPNYHAGDGHVTGSYSLRITKQ